MKVAVLTTETPHHIYFVRELQKIFGGIIVFSETLSLKAAFDTSHSFEGLRDDFEWNEWFNGRKTGFSEYAKVYSFSSMNEENAIQALKKENPDMVLVFGTGLLKEHLIGVCPNNIYNLHGGDPESYRGLDSHLWAIYHQDFSSLVATLHKLEASLDTGDIVLQAQIPLSQGMGLHMLRAANTQSCVQLAVATIDMCSRYGNVVSRRQRQVGRYYSFMPSTLKSICCKNFEKYIKSEFKHEA